MGIKLNKDTDEVLNFDDFDSQIGAVLFKKLGVSFLPEHGNGLEGDSGFDFSWD